MANVPGNLSKLNDVEISAGSPLTEAVMNKIAANINGLIDITGNYQLYTSDGTFTAPENTHRVFLFGCGGGGGGGKGIGGNWYVGGCGGFGAVPYTLTAAVTPGQTYNISIGSGGTGAKTSAGPSTFTSVQNIRFYVGARGSTGGNTVFSSNTGSVTFYGAPGGWGGVYAIFGNNSGYWYDPTSAGRQAVVTNVIQKPPGIFTVGGSSETSGSNVGYATNLGSIGNYGWTYVATGFPSSQIAPAGYNDLSLSGQASPFASGGTGYPYIGATTGSGGGGAGFGPGGNGGNGAVVGQDAAVTSFGAGGGGGGHDQWGGDGAPGFLMVCW